MGKLPRVGRAEAPGWSVGSGGGAAAARCWDVASLTLPPSPVSPDFTGYWALVRTEGMDNFLKAAGFPWVVRKAALRFGGSAVDGALGGGCPVASVGPASSPPSSPPHL